MATTVAAIECCVSFPTLHKASALRRRIGSYTSVYLSIGWPIERQAAYAVTDHIGSQSPLMLSRIGMLGTDLNSAISPEWIHERIAMEIAKSAIASATKNKRAKLPWRHISPA